MKIYLDPQACKYRRAIEEMLDDLLLFDCNFSGKSYEIYEEPDLDCHYVDEIGEDLGVKVFHKISDLVEF
jgi:hypothetical protein